MKKSVIPPLLFFLLVISLFTGIVTAQAISVELQRANGNYTVIIKNVESDVGAYGVVITYDPNITSILSISSVPPFTVVSNINNTAGVTYISGFHGQIPGPTGDVRLAILQIKGSDNVNIAVEELIDTSGKDIYISSANEQQMEKPYREEGNSETQGIVPEGALLPSPSAPPTEETPSVTLTPTPTVTLTVLPTIVPSPTTIVTTATTTPAPTTTPRPIIPGFEGTFSIAGLFVVAYLVLRRRK